MKRQRYNLTGKWSVRAPLDLTWGAFANSETWQEWWPDIKQVKQLETPRLVALRWRGIMGFALHIVVDTEDFKEEEFIKLRYSGDISGIGEVRFKAKNKHTTTVTFASEIKTVKPWMNVRVKWLRKLFVYTYGRGMKRAKKSLNKYLAEK